jgi:hypothetical protein
VVLRLKRSGAGQEEEGWKPVHHRRRDRRARLQLLLRQRNLRVNTKDNSSAALPSLLRNSPEALRINRPKVNIEALDLSKLLPPLRGLPMRVELENKKGRKPLPNPALRPPLVRLKVKPGAENSEARELTRNPAVLPAGDRPLVVDKRNPRAERKKASKVLQLPLALNDANLNLG